MSNDRSWVDGGYLSIYLAAIVWTKKNKLLVSSVEKPRNKVSATDAICVSLCKKTIKLAELSEISFGVLGVSSSCSFPVHFVACEYHPSAPLPV